MSVKRRHRIRRPAHRQLTAAAEICETRQLLSATTAPLDGTGNNILNPEWGSTDEELLRIATAEYGDGVSAPAGQYRLSARVVSNVLAGQTDFETNDRGLTDLTWLWGQFLDHDIGLTSEAHPEEAFSIAVPAGDPWFDPFGTGIETIDLNRSVYVNGEGSSDGLRQQLNNITAFIDGSVVYGSDVERAAELRTFSGGLLKTSAGQLLPFNENGLENAGGTDSSLFLAGDVRANENVALTSMHTIFVREHNRIAQQLAAEEPSLTDQQLYEQARSIVAAEIQAITFNEFLPALFGPDAVDAYTGYDATVHPGIANEFSTAAYRFGHTMLSPNLSRLNADGTAADTGDLALRDAFFHPQILIDHGVDSLLQGAAAQVAQEIDTQVIDDVRNFLFGPPGSGGLDLPSLNIQRGRDHGLADYNATRVALGLPAVTSFSQITSDAELATALSKTYGSVNEIDLWVGGLAEDHLPGTSMGETFTEIIVDQFERLRDGDRFWYENIFSGEMLEAINNTRLSDVIMRNSGVESLQTNAFFVAGSEPVFMDLAAVDAPRVNVRLDQGMVVVTDTSDGTTLLQRATGDLGSLILRGSPDRVQHVSVSAAIPGAAIPQGIRFESDAADELSLVGTAADDTLLVDGNHVQANTLDVVFGSIGELLLNGESGDDLLRVTSSTVRHFTLDGGAGNDRLIGSALNDHLFGGPGDDTLLGGDGDDQLYGGTGNDRLLGQRGHDRLIGNAGTDLLLQEGNEDDPLNLQPEAEFLDTVFNIRSTGNEYLNWGGANEKWVYSDRGWMFITPEGGLYEWDRSRRATGTLIANLPADVWNHPELLHATSGEFSDMDSPDSLRRLAHDLDEELKLRKVNHYYENWGGRQEKWMYGRDGWVFMTADGRLFDWDGSRQATGRLIAELDPGYYLDPHLLHGSRS